MNTPIGQMSRQGVCIVDGCEMGREARGLCPAHRTRARSGGDASAPVKPRRPKAPGKWGDWKVRRDGYRVRQRWNPETKSNEWELEHRSVMEAILGRSLLKGENVHHINGVRWDNRPENLELWVSSQPAGQRPADLLDWARVIISRYGDTL